MSPLSSETKYSSKKEPSIMSSSLENENICICEASTNLSEHVVIVLSFDSESSDAKIFWVNLIL